MKPSRTLLIVSLTSLVIVVISALFAARYYSTRKVQAVTHENPTFASEDLIPTTSGNVMLTANAASRVFYVSVNGKSSNDGSSPKRPLNLDIIMSARASPVRSGDTVIFSSGIYRADKLDFAPEGESYARRTIFKAAPDERVIFTTLDDAPPTVYIKDFVRLENLWFGGQQIVGNDRGFFPGGSKRYGTGRSKQLINCTIFGYREGNSQGNAEFMLYQGNRYVRSGREKLHHAIYLSGGYKSGLKAQHAIVDNNIIISGNAYGINGWHNPHSNIITRNFFARSAYGIAMNGSDHIIANNFFWKMKGYPGKKGGWGAWLPGQRIVFINNIMGIGAGIHVDARDNKGDDPTDTAEGARPLAAAIFGKTSKDDSPRTNLLARNAFLETLPLGAEFIELSSTRIPQQLGMSEQDIDDAVRRLESAFSKSVADIYADQTIEPLFAKLKLTIPMGSPLYRGGKSWFGNAPINIGPDSPAPATEDDFWRAFRALGLRDFDRFGAVVKP